MPTDESFPSSARGGRFAACFLMAAILLGVGSPALAVLGGWSKSTRRLVRAAKRYTPPEKIPRVFSKSGYEEEKASAAANGRYFVMWFGDPDDRESEEMRRTTWQNLRLEDWIRQSAVACSIDTAKRPELMEKYQVEYLPSLLVFKGEHGIFEFPGYASADEILAALRDAKAGKFDTPVEDPNKAKPLGG